jgi:hypothetical protein
MRIAIKSHPSSSFAASELRLLFVEFVAAILSAGRTRSFKPTQLNATNDLEWSVCETNNWWVIFDQQDSSLVYLQDRYDVKIAIDALAAWVAYCWCAKVE